MSSSTAGRKAKVYWSTNNGASSYNLIAGIDMVSGGPESPEITDDEFGIGYEQSLTGIIGLNFTMSGGSRLRNDEFGQDALYARFLDGSTSPNGYVAVLFNGTNRGWKAAVNISKVAVDAKVRDKVNISIEGKTTGAFLQFGTVSLP